MAITCGVLVEVMRGSTIESWHRGAAAIVDSRGRLLSAWGDVDRPMLPRSAVKPLQAIPLVRTGAAQRFRLSAAEIALACASHAGESEHVVCVREWLTRLGLNEDDLVCGSQPPLDPATAETLVRQGRPPSRLHNNCSGKHVGMLSVARHLGVPTAGYASPEHPVQQLVRQAVTEACVWDMAAVPDAADGCGVPIFALPLTALARGFAVLAAPEQAVAPLSAPLAQIATAMTAQPWHVGGSTRFDTRVMVSAGGAVLVKSGAEGVCAAALRREGIGIALKIDDGAKRAAETAMAALILRCLSVCAPAGLRQTLSAILKAPVTDTRGIPVGLVRCAPGWPG